MWLIGAMVCLLAAPWVQLSVSAGNGWPHNALRHHWLMPISCHFRDSKALLVTSLTHVSGAIASVQIFTFTFTAYYCTSDCIAITKARISNVSLTTRSRSSLFLVPPTTPMAAVNSSMAATKMIIVAGVIRTSLIAWYCRLTLITHTPIANISNPTI